MTLSVCVCQKSGIISNDNNEKCIVDIWTNIEDNKGMLLRRKYLVEQECILLK